MQLDPFLGEQQYCNTLLLKVAFPNTVSVFICSSQDVLCCC